MGLRLRIDGMWRYNERTMFDVRILKKYWKERIKFVYLRREIQKERKKNVIIKEE